VLNNTFDFPCFVDETQRGVTHGSSFFLATPSLEFFDRHLGREKECLETGASVVFLFFAILMEGKSLLLALLEGKGKLD